MDMFYCFAAIPQCALAMHYPGLRQPINGLDTDIFDSEVQPPAVYHFVLPIYSPNLIATVITGNDGEDRNKWLEPGRRCILVDVL